MNKKYLYLISGLLLCVCVLIAYQVTQAAISNPGHGTSALEGNASLNMNSNKIINLLTPTADTDATTKAYVDAAGSKVAFRLIPLCTSPCPTISGVTCRVKLGWHNQVLYNAVACDANCGLNQMGVCLYSTE